MAAGDGIYARLEQAVAELSELLAELEQVIAHKPREGFRPAGASGTPGRPGSMLTSWNTAVAMVILEVHSGARELEVNLRYRNTGKIRERGGSDGNTLLALRSVCSLAVAAGDAELHHAARTVEGWVWRARLALGQREPWVHVPRIPGKRAPRCPWCDYTTLRMKPLTGKVRCVNPSCRDEHGRQPVGTVEFGPGFGEPLLVWQDDSVGLATEEERIAT